MSGAGSAVQVGTAEVAVKVDLGPLEKGFAQAKQATQQFENSANRTSNVVEGRFARSLNATTQAATRFNNSIARTSASIGLLPGPVGVAAARMTALTTAIGGVSPVIAGGVIAIGALVGAFGKALREAEAFEQQTLRLNAVLEATGFAAGLTADRINEFAEELEETTLASSDDIKKAAESLATFGSVSGDEFERTIRVAQDLAGSLGGVVNATNALGRAFERPAEMARIFRRIGLHEVVLKQAQAMQDAGREAESYTFILDALEKKVGGVGIAEAQGVTGAFHRLTDATDDFFRTIGQEFGVLDATETGLDLVTAAVRGLESALKGAVDVYRELQLLVEDPFGPALDPTRLPFAGPDTMGIVAAGRAKEAAERKKADDAALAALEAQEKATKAAREEIERLAKAEADRLDRLEVQREQTLEDALAEAAVLEANVPRLLASGLAQEEVTEELAFQMELSKTLRDLELERGSAWAQAIEVALRRIKDFNDELERTLENREAIEESVEVTARALDVAGAAELGVLVNFNSALGDLNREFTALSETYDATEGQAAAFRFEQEAISRTMEEVGFVSDEQAESIRTLAEAYGRTAQALADLERAHRASDFFGGELNAALEDIIFNAESLTDAFNNLAQSIAKAALEALLFGSGPLGGGRGSGLLNAGLGALGSLFGGPAGGSLGVMGADALVAAGLFHRGGTVGGQSPTRDVPVREFIRAPRYHSGLFGPNEMPAVLERGEVVLSRRTVAEMRGRGDDARVNIYAPISVPMPRGMDVRDFRPALGKLSASLVRAIGEAQNRHN